MNPLHVMCRLTCSRCWHQLMRHYSQKQEKPLSEICIFFAGDGRYLAAAQKLADDLFLPVRLISSTNSAPIMWHQFT